MWSKHMLNSQMIQIKALIWYFKGCKQKFLETGHHNERNNTMKANLNTMVQITNNDNPKKMNTSFNQSM